MLQQTTVFSVTFHLRAICQNVVSKFDESARSLVWKTFIFEALVSLRVANAALAALSLSHVPWLVCVVFGTLLDIWNLLLCLLRWHSNIQYHQSVEERNLLSGANQFFFVLMDAAVSACTEMRNVRACFHDVTTRMLCFVLQDS